MRVGRPAVPDDPQTRERWPVVGLPVAEHVVEVWVEVLIRRVPRFLQVVVVSTSLIARIAASVSE